ncbi:MAG: glutamine amidotransferase [Chloroflexi bacterium]|nr:glutamine amidotransferase [Chloroflexota bacterium]
MVVHLFPDLLNLYGDSGNVRVLAQRCRWRGFEVDVRAAGADDGRALADADIVFIGGGQDRQQVAVARGLERLAVPLRDTVAGGASLVAVCGGYQNLGHDYRSPLVGDLVGPGLLDVETSAGADSERAVGGVVVQLPDGSPIAELGRASAERAGHRGAAAELVGFENHSGQTVLGPGARDLGSVVVGNGNDGRGREGFLAMPGDAGMAGLRIGTYLHGPVMPRNPHLADFVILSALRRRGVSELAPLDDRSEWAAHAAFADHWLALRRPAGAASPLRRLVDRVGSLLGPSA